MGFGFFCTHTHTLPLSLHSMPKVCELLLGGIVALQAAFSFYLVQGRIERSEVVSGQFLQERLDCHSVATPRYPSSDLKACLHFCYLGIAMGVCVCVIVEGVINPSAEMVFLMPFPCRSGDRSSLPSFYLAQGLPIDYHWGDHCFDYFYYGCHRNNPYLVRFVILRRIILVPSLMCCPCFIVYLLDCKRAKLPCPVVHLP